MTPQQQQAARDYKKRQAREKRFIDLMGSMERNPRRIWIMAGVLAAILAIQLWPQ